MDRKLKILLIIPVKGGHQYISFGVGYISAYLKRFMAGKVDIKLADENAGDDVLDLYRQFNPDLVGITSTTPQIVRAGEIAAAIREYNDGVPIVLGGIHGSVLPEKTLADYPALDIIVVGEGEETMLELCLLLSKKEGKPDEQELSAIDGLFFRSSTGQTVATNKRKIIEDLDQIPHLDREIFNSGYYFRPRQLIRGFPARRSTSILTSRGCPYQCRFCASNIMARKYRTCSVAYIIEEIDYLVTHYGIEALYFHDDLFIANKQRVSDLCRALIERNYHKKLIWSCQVRANLVNEDTIPLLQQMKEAGCRQLEFGFESGSERVLEFLKRAAASVQQNQKALEISKTVGLRVFGNFMIGAVTETMAELQETENFIRKNLDLLDFFQVYITVPFPGTDLWQLCLEHRLINEEERFENFFLYNGDNIVRSFSDTVPREYLEKEVQYLNSLALRKISLPEKIYWLRRNLLSNPNMVFRRLVPYLISRAIKK